MIPPNPCCPKTSLAPSIAAFIYSSNSPLRPNSCSPRSLAHFHKGRIHPVHSPLHHLGQTRSSQHRNHLLLTPDTFVRTTLPGMSRAAAIVHIGPALGAAFTQYTAELEADGQLGPAAAQRFLYVMEGSATLEANGKQQRLGPRGFAYIPEKLAHRFAASAASRVAVIEKT